MTHFSENKTAALITSSEAAIKTRQKNHIISRGSLQAKSQFRIWLGLSRCVLHMR